MAEIFTWDQSRFNGVLKDYLMAHESAVWPQLLNTKAFYVAYSAVGESPQVMSQTIVSELMRPVMPGSGLAPHLAAAMGAKEVPVGYIIAAKRASKLWPAVKWQKVKEFADIGRKSIDLRAQWFRAVKDRFERMVGGRKRAAGFINVGWWGVMKLLGPHCGSKFKRPSGKADVRFYGRVKGIVSPATASNLSVRIENTAHAKSEILGAFERLGGAALERAIAAEAADTQRHMEEAMDPGIQDFNRRNGHR
jgi:hypothetical protein